MSLEKSAEIGRRLRARGLTIGLAESCTGGAVASALTDVAGSSDYLLGGVVAYSNQAKERLLGVEGGVLSTHGAVSEPVARQMAEGARQAFGAGLGIGITGILGPSGGSAGKPAGLVYMAVATAGGTEVRRYQWSGDRLMNKRQSLEAALDLILEQIP